MPLCLGSRERNSQVLASRVAKEDATAVCANINPSINPRVTNNLKDESPLVLIVVDSRPGARLVNGPEDAGLPMNSPDQVESRIGMVRGRFAEAEGVDFLDAW
jgi:hypothetical protein